MDSASPRALLVTYCASSSTTRVESSRSSEVFGENQRSMERFISWKLKRNMKTAGVRAMRTAPSTMRVRRRAPRALLLWSGVELEDVPEQQQKQDEEKEEDDDGEAGKGEGFASGFRIEEADVGGIEGIEPPSRAKNRRTPHPSRIRYAVVDRPGKSWGDYRRDQRQWTVVSCQKAAEGLGTGPLPGASAGRGILASPPICR